VDRTLSADVNIGAIVFSADGKLLRGLCQDNKLRSWDIASGAIRQTLAFEDGDLAPVFTANGLTTMGKDGSLKTWDLVTGKVAKRLPGAGRHSRRVVAPADGSAYLSDGRTEIKVRALDANGKEKFVVPSGLGGLGAFAISPDGSNVVAASYDADVRAWNSRNGELLRLIDELPVSMFDLKFSPDGKWLAAAGADRILYLYDTKTWKQSRALSGQPEMISAVAFSPDGNRIATGGFSELTQKNAVKVLVWDVKSGTKVRVFDAKQRVSSVVFSPDGGSLAVSTGTKTVEVWQVAG